MPRPEAAAAPASAVPPPPPAEPLPPRGSSLVNDSLINELLAPLTKPLTKRELEEEVAIVSRELW